MAYESLTEQERYEMWVQYIELCAEEYEKRKSAGLTSNNVNPADFDPEARPPHNRKTTRPARQAQTNAQETESSQLPDF
jgi:hypothetical protein